MVRVRVSVEIMVKIMISVSVWLNKLLWAMRGQVSVVVIVKVTVSFNITQNITTTEMSKPYAKVTCILLSLTKNTDSANGRHEINRLVLPPNNNLAQPAMFFRD